MLQRKLRKLSINSTERIIGFIHFRDHYSSNPGKHSWELCGHPVYYWTFKAALQSVYLEKIIVWTEVKAALQMAKEMSARFITIERPLRECREPEWKNGHSIYSNIHRRQWNVGQREEEAEQILGFKPTVMVRLIADSPLITAEDIDKLIKTFLDTNIPFIHLGTKLSNPVYYQDILFAYPGLSLMGIRRQDSSILTYLDQGTRLFKVPRDFSTQREWIVEIPFENAINIHTKEDLELAEFYMKKRVKK